MNETELMIKDCLKRQSKLTVWEEKFINAISRSKKPLSVCQLELLDKIWEKVT